MFVTLISFRLRLSDGHESSPSPCFQKVSEHFWYKLLTIHLVNPTFKIGLLEFWFWLNVYFEYWVSGLWGLNIFSGIHRIREYFTILSSAWYSCVMWFSHASQDSIHVYMYTFPYGVATVSRLLEIIGLFCRISSLL